LYEFLHTILPAEIQILFRKKLFLHARFLKNAKLTIIQMKISIINEKNYPINPCDTVHSLELIRAKPTNCCWKKLC